METVTENKLSRHELRENRLTRWEQELIISRLQGKYTKPLEKRIGFLRERVVAERENEQKT